MAAYLLAAGPDWGTVPDWLAAFGTLAAFFVALRLLAKELAARREQEEDRRTEQARLVAAWMTSKWASETEVRHSIVMRNGSDEPIFDGLCVPVPNTSRYASDPLTLLEPGRPEGTNMMFDYVLTFQILPPHEMRESDLPLPELWTSPWNVAIGLSFTDAAGRRWKRYPDGRLVEPDRPRRRSRKDFYNAWIAGQLDHLDY
jgi:hypothetical protein